MIFDFLAKAGGKEITTSSELADYLNGTTNSLSGVSVTPESAMKFAPVFACIKVLAESVGQLPLHLYERISGKEKEKAINHGLYSLLHDEPNEYQTSQEFFEMLVVHLCLAGNFYAYKNWSRATGKVLELLPLQPSAVKPILDDEYNVSYKVTFANGTTDVLPKEDVFHVKGLSFNGYEGVSAITYARETIGLGIATERHGSKLFSNGAKPGGILSTEQNLKKEQIEDIREQWNALHAGIDNSHRTAILQGGLKWAQVGLSSEDAQFLETRKFQRSEICGIFRVPPHMIADLERSTNNNIEHQGLEFVVYSLMPILRRVEQRIGKSLLSKKDISKYFAKFNVNGLLRGDMKTRAQFYKSMFGMGALSPNDIRELEDLNPRDGGDEYFVPLNMIDKEEPSNDDEKQT